MALYQAGRHISSPLVAEHKFNAYREALVEHFSMLLGSKTESHIGNEMRSRVTVTWELSIRQLERNGYEGSREMLELLSCYWASIPIPIEIVGGLRIRPPVVITPIRTRALVIPGKPCASWHTIKTQLKALRSVGLIDIDEMSSSEEGKFAVILHPLVAETVWRYIHEKADGGPGYRRHRPYIAKRACGATAAASVIIGMQDEDYRAIAWNLIYSHLVKLLIDEADYLTKRELAELLLATNRAVESMMMTGALTGVFSTDRAWNPLHLMEMKAQPWGSNWFFAAVNLKFSNLDRYYYLR